MTYTNAQGQTQILADASDASARLGVALAELAEAYEHLDEPMADRIEAELHRPLQAAYGRLKRTIREFAGRTGLVAPDGETTTRPAPQDPRLALQDAADAIQSADEILAALQDTLLPVEVGDAELRSGLTQTRSAITALPALCDGLVHTLGR
ncbi:MAG: hypothetical protein ACP5H2_04455 [Solirubrobacteraceae bacterium]